MATSFDYKERLGAGHFGEVWRVVDTALNAVRAVKLILPSAVLNPNNVFLEAQTLKAAEHPNVVRVEEAGTLSDGRIYLAMEYLPKGSLEDEARGAYVDLTRAQRIMIDVLRGLQYAHDRGVLHRDIKPANILVGMHGQGKLSDFGLAVPEGVDLKALGVKDYAYIVHCAREVIERGDYSVRSDIYAAGITLYRLVNGDSVLPPISSVDIRQAIIDGKYPDRARYREFAPRSLRTLINRSIDIDATKRFQSAEKMRHALERIDLQMNWNEQVLTNGFRWASGWNHRCYEVTRIRRADGRWCVETRKGPSKRKLRRINAHCFEGLSKARAEQLTKRVLQDFVLGRLK